MDVTHDLKERMMDKMLDGCCVYVNEHGHIIAGDLDDIPMDLGKPSHIFVGIQHDPTDDDGIEERSLWDMVEEAKEVKRNES